MKNHAQKIKKGKECSSHTIWRYMTLLIICLSLPLLAFAQTKTVRGTVMDTNGEPIPGASVVISGTQQGTLTDADGRFSIEASANDKLTISFLGFLKQEVAVGSNTQLSIEMTEGTSDLDEVVVTGYMTQKKATLTGAVASVSNKEIVATKNENVVNMLAGKLPGLRVTQITSRPGALGDGVRFDIRGMGDPLIIVDGVASDKNAFASIDPNDIENVSILKDASAAIYGLRSANGVVLVTTKRGSAKGFEIQYAFNAGWQSFLHVPDNVDAVQFMTLLNEERYGNNWYESLTGVTQPRFTQSDFEPYLNGTKHTANWMDAVFKNTATQSQHNVTINGGSDAVKYYANVGYMEQNSAFKSNSINYDRWNLRSNVDVNITKRLRASMSLSGYMDETLEPSYTLWQLYKTVFMQLPTVSPYANDNPAYINAGNGQAGDMIMDNVNPVGQSNSDYVGSRKRVRRNFNGQLSLSYDIPGVKGLTAKALYNYKYDNDTNNNYLKTFTAYIYDADNDTYIPSGTYGGRNSRNSIEMSDSKTTTQMMQLSLNYQGQFGDHGVSALALYEEASGNGIGFRAQRYLDLASEYLAAATANGQEGIGNWPWDNAYQSFVGYATYNYKGKYIVDGSLRYDGSSRFPKDSRWGLFGSVGLGYRISEETWFKELPLSFITNLKFRGKYGVLGDDGGAPNYRELSAAYAIDGNTKWIYDKDGNITEGVRPTSLPNPNLTWYTSKMLDLGLDIELWNGLFGAEFSYYVRNRSGLLETSLTTLPKTVGASMPKENLESDRSFGYDLQIFHRNKIGKDFSYNISANMFSTRNQWTEIIQGPASSSWDNYRRLENVNRYQNIWRTRRSLGQFQSFNDIYQWSNYSIGGGAGWTPGEFYYEDWNGDGTINEEDEQALSNTGLPLFNYGFNIGASWKGIDFTASFQGAARVFQQYTETYANPRYQGGGINSKFWDRWHPEDPTQTYNPNSKWIPGKYERIRNHDTDQDGSTKIQNASYLRLKTVEIGYTLPPALLAKVGIKGLRVYVSGYNLLTFTGLDGMDPEHPGGNGGTTVGSDGRTNGADVFMYPMNRTFNVGASIKF